MQYGLLGRKLGHSYSPQIHAQLGTYPYELFEKEPDELEAFLRSDAFSGLNVTIPYKKAVIPCCDELSDCAKKLGAVNTIVRRPDGTLIGHNTDYFGFSSMLAKSGINVRGKKVLVLGSGGASVTVVEVLRNQHANVVVISRSGENNYTNLHRHVDAAMIVNATPVGMYPAVDECPVDIEMFPHLEGVLDLIYNPSNTALLQAAEKRGIIVQNGLWMLVAQAKESAQWFIGKEIPDSVISKIYHKLKQEMENIVLIGMPGSGKSTIGKELATRLGRVFTDADEQIIKTAGVPIAQIFETGGEAEFRRIETEVLSRIAKESGLVIATGGGCVTREENYPLLHRNGVILWIKRNIQELPTYGRPLSQTGNLEKMYNLRKPMYERFSDFAVDNSGQIDDVVTQIINSLHEGGTK